MTDMAIIGAGITGIAQAAPSFTMQHLKENLPKIACRKPPMLCDSLGASEGGVTYGVAHRWRYACAVTPPGGHSCAMRRVCSIFGLTGALARGSKMRGPAQQLSPAIFWRDCNDV